MIVKSEIGKAAIHLADLLNEKVMGDVSKLSLIELCVVNACYKLIEQEREK